MEIGDPMAVWVQLVRPHICCCAGGLTLIRRWSELTSPRVRSTP
jgi:hypothetical protein